MAIIYTAIKYEKTAVNKSENYFQFSIIAIKQPKNPIMMRLIFMGTPDFAVPSLRILHEQGYNIVAVITATDKPAGRGGHLQMSAVKKYALEHNLPVLQPSNLKDPAFSEQLQALQPDLQVVVAFRMLPMSVITAAKYGTINLHASLLPQYRGAAPINWAVANGETETGVTTFFIEQKLDTGNIIFQEKTPILPHENAGDIHDRLMTMGADLVLKTVDAIATQTAVAHPQPMVENSKPAPKIFTPTCELHFEQSCVVLHNLVRGLSPYPAAFTTWNGQSLKVFATEALPTPHSYPIGTVVSDGKYVDVATVDGFLRLLEVQLAGRKRMDIAAFLRGQKLVAALPC